MVSFKPIIIGHLHYRKAILTTTTLIKCRKQLQFMWLISQVLPNDRGKESLEAPSSRNQSQLYFTSRCDTRVTACSSNT